jgi:hypothetical protein
VELGSRMFWRGRITAMAEDGISTDFLRGVRAGEVVASRGSPSGRPCPGRTVGGVVGWPACTRRLVRAGTQRACWRAGHGIVIVPLSLHP